MIGERWGIRGWPLTALMGWKRLAPGEASDLGYPWIPCQTWQQWQFTINDSWWFMRSNLPFFLIFLDCSSPKTGIAMLCLFMMFQFILVSWVCLNKKWIAGESWIAPFLARKIFPARSWNIYWMEFGMGFHMRPLYKYGYDMVRLKHWLPMGPISPSACLWTWLGWTLKLWPWPWAIQRLTYGLPDVDWQSTSVHQ